MTLKQTIGELQAKISWSEYTLWGAYRSKYGPLSPVRKYDRGFAMVLSSMHNIMGGKTKPQDFIFYGNDDPTADDDKKQKSDLQAFVQSLGGGLKIGKRKRR